MTRRTPVEKRVLAAVDFARRIVPGYGSGRGPIVRAELDKLAAYLNVKVTICDLDQPTILLPPFGAPRRYRLLIDAGLHRDTRDYVIRHELGHVLAEDASEPTMFQFAGPLPEAEDVADLFALADMISIEDAAQGEDWIAHRMRELVVLDYAPWYLRTKELPAKVVRMRHLIEEWLDTE